MQKLTIALAVPVLLWTGLALSAPDPKATATTGPVLPCKRLDWLSDCEQINERAKANPGAPLRVTDPAGLEFNFAPGTPSVIIEHMLKPSAATADRVIDFYDAHMARAELAANLSREAMLRRGGGRFNNIALIEAKEAAADLSGPVDRSLTRDLSDTTLFFFYDSKCPHCLEMFTEVAKVIESYPTLKISFLQMNDDDEFLQKVDADFRGDVIPLTGELRAKYATRVKSTPELWLQNTKTKQTKVMQGFQKAEAIARMLQQP